MIDAMQYVNIIDMRDIFKDYKFLND